MLSKKWFLGLAVASASVMLAACGGGGGGSDSGAVVSGTAAQGKALVGGDVALTCANGVKLTGKTDASGKYSTSSASLAYPCVGTVTSGSLTYRTILFSGNVANFTPLTDILVSVVLAAAREASIDSLIARASTVNIFANSLINSAPTYRTSTITVLQNAGVSVGVLNTLNTSFSNFESLAFNADGTGLDGVLDSTKSAIQSGDGSVIPSVTTIAKTEGAKLPSPTGASGASGAN